MSVLNTFQYKQCLRILAFSKCNERDYRPEVKHSEEKNSKEQPVVANEVPVNVRTKNTFKYDYFPVILLSLKNA